jgi:Na+-driven multidrug efflux pump
MEWGPIYWGFIGAGFGFLLGFSIDLFIHKVYLKRKRPLKGKKSDVILVIDCNKEQVDHVEKILWEHFAIGVATLYTNEGGSTES